MGGEVSVVGLVSDYHVIEDIGVRVPKGVAVQVSADLALQSRDFYQALANNQIVVVGSAPALRAVGGSSEVDRLTKELATSKAQVEAHAERIEKLEADLEALRVVNLQLKEDMARAQTGSSGAGVSTAKNALRKLRQAAQ